VEYMNFLNFLNLRDIRVFYLQKKSVAGERVKGTVPQ
jgi:hypothetical protein